MLESLKKHNLKKVAGTTVRTSEVDDMAMTGSYNLAGCYINNKEVETRVDRYLYKNGNVLLKVYRNDHLCMLTMTKAEV